MSVYSTSLTDILGVYIVYVCIVIVLIENTCEMQFHTYSPRPKRRQVVVAHWFCAGGNSAQATPWLLVRTWNRAAGVRIPDSYFRSQTGYNRWAFPDSGIPAREPHTCGGQQVCPTPHTCT